MKLDKENYTLTLSVFTDSENEFSYEGNFSVSYIEKLFRKTVTLQDYAHISPEHRKLSDSEYKALTQLKKLILKELEPKGFILDTMHFSFNHLIGGDIDIQFMFGEEMNNISFNMGERHSVATKSYNFCKSITNRLLKELK